MKAIVTLWKFGRPHTLIGSMISICTLYAIVCEKNLTLYIPLLIIALIIGITCNLFIVGINQIADVNIDRINKPYLPIAAGDLKSQSAKIIVFVSLFISLGLALYISIYLFAIILLSALIGWAYSMPPFHLKRHHLLAALAITTVRGVLINLGGFLVFNYIVNKSLGIPENVKILTLFIIAFSIAISWFKDLPDVEGDSKYNIRTLAILYSSKVALIAGHILVGSAYLFTIYLKSIDIKSSENPALETQILFYGHLVLFALFILNAFSIQLQKHESVKQFYKRFWLFFFAEYLLYFAAYFIKADK
jgi:homogentisate phytyltransferase/homogentisate geranylgeranyltransferase